MPLGSKITDNNISFFRNIHRSNNVEKYHFTVSISNVLCNIAVPTLLRYFYCPFMSLALYNSMFSQVYNCVPVSTLGKHLYVWLLNFGQGFELLGFLLIKKTVKYSYIHLNIRLRDLMKNLVRSLPLPTIFYDV